MNSTLNIPTDTLFIADNLALDFINTAYGVGGNQHDCFTDDNSVVEWLRLAGQLPREFQEVNQAPDGLLDLAREFRSGARVVIENAISGVIPDLAVVNRLLESGRPVREIEWNHKSGMFNIVKRLRYNDPSCLLEPVAESLASLLASDKFGFVRQCEGPDCILLFHDLTKSHRRRWCSMATCGNRMKVAAFRSRKKTE